MMYPSKPLILLVEDDHLLLLDARIALEDAGYAVIEASDGDAALAHFRSRDDIAAIVSDVSMPGAIDGLGLAATVRAAKPDLPIVLTTGRPRTIDAPAGVRVVSKPYTSRQLARCLDVAVADAPI